MLRLERVRLHCGCEGGSLIIIRGARLHEHGDVDGAGGISCGVESTYFLKIAFFFRKFSKDCPSPQTESRVSFTFSQSKSQHQRRALSAPSEQHASHPGRPLGLVPAIMYWH